MLLKHYNFKSIFISVNPVWLDLVNRRTKQVETLFDVLEDIDPKLEALGIVEINGAMVYNKGTDEVDHV